MSSPTVLSPALTLVGFILGTAAYLAPERAKGKPVDRRADAAANRLRSASATRAAPAAAINR